MKVQAPQNSPPHALQVPIPVLPLAEMLPEIDASGLPTFEEAMAGWHPSKGLHGNPAYQNFIYRAYCLLCATANKEDEQLARGRARFRDQVIVDLGCGRSIDGYSLACGVEANAYVGVEPFHTAALFVAFSVGQQPHEVFEQVPLSGYMVPASVVCDHALAFLRRVPDDSVSIIASGLDRMILDDDYGLELEKEIVRTLHPEGMALCCKSMLKPPGLVRETVSPGDYLDCYYKGG